MSTADVERRGSSIPIHEAHHDPEGDAELSATIIEAIAAAEGVDPTDCNLGLYGAVDLESLDTLFERRSREGRWRFEFSVEDRLVAVEGDGRVTIRET